MELAEWLKSPLYWERRFWSCDQGLSGGRSYARWSGGTTGERRVCKDDAESDDRYEHVGGGPRQVGFRVWRWVCFLITLVWWLGWFRILVWKWFFPPSEHWMRCSTINSFQNTEILFHSGLLRLLYIAFPPFFVEACRIFSFPQESETSEQYSWVDFFSSTLWAFYTLLVFSSGKLAWMISFVLFSLLFLWESLLFGWQPFPTHHLIFLFSLPPPFSVFLVFQMMFSTLFF